MNSARPRLAFVSPSFLFPNDTGGRIRTTNVLRGLKGGAFDVTLLAPASAAQQRDWAGEIKGVCDRFIAWEPESARPQWMRALGLWRDLPVNVQSDRTPAGLRAVHELLAGERFDVVVFDFVHAAVLRPAHVDAATVCFTHNVEAEIFARHVKAAGNPLMRAVWASQAGKMQQFERTALRAFDTVVAVSERDADWFREHYQLAAVDTIPTGVDLDFFAWREPPALDEAHAPTLVFTGSMDWAANIDGIRHFLAEVWPRVRQARPDARLVVVGRRPPATLVEQAKALPGVQLTGYVDDVRPYVHAAHVFIIPLRVGGGTRIKAFEAMAMGCPVVSTAIGIEGLDVQPDEHFLLRDAAQDQAEAILRLLGDAALRNRLSRQARRCVEERFGHRVVARVFERICLDALQRRATAAVAA
ncbi:glycosyltransferase [Piscinibacter defluvii]|uniref:glycosyltransferase n=1 Tax=Piscinibacter defluvii TaxID=1796922 RepID=UPI0013E2E9AD|nr:glycosyltransferase [Piscinibacter defluvii]